MSDIFKWQSSRGVIRRFTILRHIFAHLCEDGIRISRRSRHRDIRNIETTNWTACIANEVGTVFWCSIRFAPKSRSEWRWPGVGSVKCLEAQRGFVRLHRNAAARARRLVVYRCINDDNQLASLGRKLCCAANCGNPTNVQGTLNRMDGRTSELFYVLNSFALPIATNSCSDIRRFVCIQHWEGDSRNRWRKPVQMGWLWFYCRTTGELAASTPHYNIVPAVESIGSGGGSKNMMSKF
jgi:hypothetical protein